MNYRFIILVLLLFSCAQKPKINPDIYGTWLYVGYKAIVAGYVSSGNGYSVDESFLAYRIDNNSFTSFQRGTESFSGSIDYYDSTKTETSSMEIDENTISSGIIGSVSYALRSQCGAKLLKLTQDKGGWDPTYGPVTYEFNNYFVKVAYDSIPSSWPHNEDVTHPDSSCDIGGLIDW